MTHLVVDYSKICDSLMYVDVVCKTNFVYESRKFAHRIKVNTVN